MGELVREKREIAIAAARQKYVAAERHRAVASDGRQAFQTAQARSSNMESVRGVAS
jgi:hypothetical protein